MVDIILKCNAHNNIIKLIALSIKCDFLYDQISIFVKMYLI